MYDAFLLVFLWMEAQGKGKSKDPIHVDDDDSSDDADMDFKQLWIDWEIDVLEYVRFVVFVP